MENVYNNTSNGNKHDREWYFSEEGRIAYEQADSILKKIEYFYNYLTSGYSSGGSETDYKFAILLACGIANSRFSYSKYPDILSEKSNPFIKSYFKYGFAGYDGGASQMMECLHENSDYANKKRKASCRYDEWIALQMPQDRSMEDIYRIERLIIWLFGEFVANKELVNEPVIKYYPYEIDSFLLNYSGSEDDEYDEEDYLEEEE